MLNHSAEGDLSSDCDNKSDSMSENDNSKEIGIINNNLINTNYY